MRSSSRAVDRLSEDEFGPHLYGDREAEECDQHADEHAGSNPKGSAQRTVGRPGDGLAVRAAASLVRTGRLGGIRGFDPGVGLLIGAGGCLYRSIRGLGLGLVTALGAHCPTCSR